MRCKARRKQSITTTSTPSAPSLRGASHKATQSIIQSFHVLLKKKSLLEKSRPSNAANGDEVSSQLIAINAEIEALGGLDAYQEASTLGQDKERGGDSSKVLVEWLKDLEEGWRMEEEIRDGDKKVDKRPMRMLEIGALSPNNYAARQPYILNTPIDLNSRHPQILKQDFMDRKVPQQEKDMFDLVSCSLVLNFVPTAEDRGRMLRLIHSHLLPSFSSYLFLVLPLPCILNSRYMTEPQFFELMREVGFTMVKKRWKQGGKVGYWLFSRQEEGKRQGVFGRKAVINEGGKRNNFAILLKDDDGETGGV